MRISIKLNFETNSFGQNKGIAIEHVKTIIKSFVETSLVDLKSKFKHYNIDMDYSTDIEKTINGIPYCVSVLYRSSVSCVNDGYELILDDDGDVIWEKNGTYAKVSKWN